MPRQTTQIISLSVCKRFYIKALAVLTQFLLVTLSHPLLNKRNHQTSAQQTEPVDNVV